MSTELNIRGKEIRDSRRSKGLCYKCGNPSEFYSCDKCKKKKFDSRFKRQQIRSRSGICMYCTELVVPGRKLCLTHTLKNTATKALGSITKWHQLKELMESQNFKCGLTGDDITWESDIEIDHIQPISNGGERDITNIRWVTKHANRLKSYHTDQELKVLLKKILKHLN